MPHEITLRLSAHHHAQLRDKAGDGPVEEAAQGVLVHALEAGPVAEQAAAHYQVFEEQIRELRRDLSISVQVLLVTVGNQSPQDARLWAEKNIG
jgi:hypothetical protein